MATNRKILEKSKNNNKCKVNGLKRYEAMLSCGCCKEILYFKNDESALKACDDAGLGIVTIMDDAGIKHEDIDTYYGLIKLTKQVLRERRKTKD